MPILSAYLLNSIRKTSIRRIYNAGLVYSSYHLSRLSGRNLHRGMPVSFAVEPTTACNLRCPECPSGLRSFSRPTGNLKTDPFERIVDQLHHHATYLTFYFQGEPYLNPNFLDMVKYASRHGLITSTSTNAHFLNDDNARKTVESGLDRLIISIDGTDQKTYQQYRKEGQLEKVIEGTKNILKWKKKLNAPHPQVVFQFLVVRPNEHQVDEVKKLGAELGVDRVVLKSAQLYDYKHGNELMPDQDQYSRYKKQPDGTYVIKNDLQNQCWRMWSSCVITWNGTVVPCCFDKDASHALGSMEEKSFEEVWKGSSYNHFRKMILKGRDQIDICKNCTEGTKVWV